MSMMGSCTNLLTQMMSPFSNENIDRYPPASTRSSLASRGAQLVLLIRRRQRASDIKVQTAEWQMSCRRGSASRFFFHLVVSRLIEHRSKRAGICVCHSVFKGPSVRVEYCEGPVV